MPGVINEINCDQLDGNVTVVMVCVTVGWILLVILLMSISLLCRRKLNFVISFELCISV